MDIVTHGLASFAVARGFFPRARKTAVAVAVIAGTIADLDWFSNFLGPSATLSWRNAYLHSILAAVVFSLLVSGTFSGLASRRRRDASADPGGEDAVTEIHASSSERPASKLGIRVLLAVSLISALLHVAMDACQSSGVMLFWPLTTRRCKADWLPAIDPWLLGILIAAIVLPELFYLVNMEIGAKSKKPRGRTGALLGLALLVVYIGTRATLHANVTALLESRTFHGEAARRVAAYPESLSLATWHGIVETESALNQIDINAFSTATFDPDASLRIYKPEPSPSLNAARNTRTAQRFLAVAQMPKASVEKTDVGYVVILRDLRHAAAGESAHEIAALIELDPDSKVTSEELVWARDLRR